MGTITTSDGCLNQPFDYPLFPVHSSLRRWLKRRNAIEPVIGHFKQDHRMGRNFLKGAQGDAINVLLSAAALNLQAAEALAFLSPISGRSVGDETEARTA